MLVLLLVSYEFYSGTYRGSSIPEAEFAQFAQRASEQLSLYMRKYTVEAPNATAENKEFAEKMAVCAMADVLYAIAAAQNGTGAVTSASIGSVSVSYGNATAIDLSRKGQARELYDAACRYLDIYRG